MPTRPPLYVPPPETPPSAPTTPKPDPSPVVSLPPKPTDRGKDCGCDLKGLQTTIAALEEQLGKLKLEPGPAGPQGDAGPPGKDGKDGAPGRDVDMTIINNLSAAVAELQRKLDTPLTVETYGQDGKLYDTVQIRLGQEPLRLQAVITPSSKATK